VALRLSKRACVVAAGLVLCAVAVCAGGIAVRLAPVPKALFSPPAASVEFVDRTGRPLRLARAEGNGSFQQPVQFVDIPPALVHATLAAEDRRFWSHPGVDWRAILRAAGQWISNGRIISGGSTITQQLIKTAQPRARTLRAKLKEAICAVRLEQIWGKQRILTEYLNRVDYGNLNTGCAAAARFYFGKPLGDLSVAECALLAGLPQSPSRLNPHARFARAQKRQQWILGRMRANGWLTDAEWERASKESLRLAQSRRVFEAPHFVDLLLQQAEDSAALAARIRASGRVRVSLDLDLNTVAGDSLRRRLAALRGQNANNGAAVVIDNATGGVLALVGSEDYFSPGVGQVNGAWAPRSPGSALKPFTYLLAFEKGASPASIVADIPVEYVTPTGAFRPVNFDRHSYGPARYRIALANSLNIPAVRVLDSIGGPAVLQERLQRCGLTTLNRAPSEYGLGLTIGNAETRLLELANAYASLARLGRFLPYSLLFDGERRQAVPLHNEAAAYLIADILSDNEARALEFGLETPLRFAFPVACKTGTSSDFRDNWAFGYTPEYTVGVWVGNFDGTPMRGVSGVSGAAPVMHDLVEELHRRGMGWYDAPPGIVEEWIDPLTGKRAPGKTGAIREKCLASSLAPQEDGSEYDAAGRLVLPSEYRDWLASADNWLGGRAVARVSDGPPHITFPPPGLTLFLDPDLPGGGRLLFPQADGGQSVAWGSPTLERRQDGGKPSFLLTEGRHELVATNLGGATATTWIVVRKR
jgi:penicillin-binding protein 1C